MTWKGKRIILENLLMTVNTYIWSDLTAFIRRYTCVLMKLLELISIHDNRLPAKCRDDESVNMLISAVAEL